MYDVNHNLILKIPLFAALTLLYSAQCNLDLVLRV